jgi:ankyrin repeat protein
MLAVRADNLALVRQLVERGARVRGDVVSKHGATPLSCAAEFGRAEVLGALLDAGAEPNETNDNSRRFPLHNCAQYGNVAAAEVLIGRGADPTKEQRSGLTPMHIAAQFGRLDVIKYLLRASRERGLALGTRATSTSGGCTPLMLATRYGHDESVAELIGDAADSAAAEVNRGDDSGWRALHRAASAGHGAVLHRLIKHGADLDATDKKGTSALLAAARSGQPKAVATLVSHGAALSKPDEQGITPLEAACSHGHDTVVKMLLLYWLAEVDADRKLASAALHLTVPRVTRVSSHRSNQGAAAVAALPSCVCHLTLSRSSPQDAPRVTAASGERENTSSPSRELASGRASPATPSIRQSSLELLSRALFAAVAAGYETIVRLLVPQACRAVL